MCCDVFTTACSKRVLCTNCVVRIGKCVVHEGQSVLCFLPMKRLLIYTARRPSVIRNAYVGLNENCELSFKEHQPLYG
jgi:hypothetical protein